MGAAASILKKKGAAGEDGEGALEDPLAQDLLYEEYYGEAGADDAEEGYDSDVEAEANERYSRRPVPADGPVETSAASGYLARQPCRSAIVAPTAYERSANAHTAPEHRLVLDFVYGYRARDTRHSVVISRDGAVVYPAGALGVAYDRETHVQRHFAGHTDDILSVALHPAGELVATGQAGRDPIVLVWNATTMQVAAELRGFHQRAVVQLAFDVTGRYLATVGLDDAHSIAVYDWNLRKMVANSKGDENRLFVCRYNPHDGRLVTGGVRHLKFWVMDGGYLVGKKGMYGRLGAPCTTLSIEFLKDGSTVTGTQSGHIFQWSASGGEECINKYESVHQGPVHDIMCTDEYVVTAGKDGKVNFFNQSMEKLFTIDMCKILENTVDVQGKPLSFYDARSPCVRSICMRDERLLVGLRSAEIYEFDVTTTESWKTHRTLITQGHSPGQLDEMKRTFTTELWGLATHPTKPQMATASDDKTVRIWDMYERRMILMRSMPSRARSVGYSMPDGKYIAVGFLRGGFIVFDSTTGVEHAAKKHRREEVSVVRYSPNGRWLAVASHDNFIDIYDTQRSYKRVGVCKGHSSYVTHVDWSVDSTFLQSSSGDLELMFWDIPSCDHVAFANAMRDVVWHTQTCTVGYTVQGIWPKYADATDIVAADRSKDHCVLAAIDDFGGLRLFRYPCDVGRGEYTFYTGHGNHASSVAFAFNDEFLITTGASDSCVMQWRHYEADEGDEDVTSEVEEEVYQSIEDYEATTSRCNAINELVITSYANGAPVYAPLTTMKLVPNKNIPQGTGLDPGSRLAYLPCASAIFPPDGYLREPDALSPSMEAFELDFAYGVRSHDVRNGVFYTNRGEVVYPSGAMAVVYNRDTNTQRFLVSDPASESITGPTSEVVCIARHPIGSIFATGEVGRNPRIMIFSSDDVKKPKAMLQGFFKKAVVSITFSRDGNLLAAVGADDDHSVGVYRWASGTLLASSPGSREKIVSINWSPFQDYIVTLGVKHCYFWATDPFRRRKALFSSRGNIQTMLCCCFPGPDTTVMGTQDGSVYLFRAYQLVTNVKRVHSVTHSCTATREVIVTGGKEGRVKFWSNDLSQCMKECDISHPLAMGSCLKSLHLLGSMLLIGTRTGEIYEMDTTSYSYGLVQQGHAYGAITGLATHPNEHQFVTCSDDGTVRMWDAYARRLIMVRNIQARGRAIDYHPDGSSLAVGLDNGGIVILSSDSLDTLHTKKDRDESIPVLRYSPNGSYLAVGSADNCIDIYDISKQYGRVGVARGHSSYIRHIDWSADSALLMSCSGDMELFFWDMPNGTLVRYPSEVRNVDWFTYTSVVGFPVQGIWPRHSTGYDILCLDRSHTRTCAAYGDEHGMLSVTQYPAHRGCARRVFGGHGSRVLNVCFLFDDTFCISVSADQLVLQWRVVI
ncbi:echinoderm microtubule-associated protein-like [Pycnococcus provasolii]